MLEVNATKSYQLNDVGNAEKLVDKFGNVVRYVPQWRSWLHYDGTRWARVDDVFMNGLAKQVLREMQLEGNVRETDTDEVRDRKSRLVNWVRVCGYGGHTELMVKQARDAVIAHPNDFDTNPWLVNATDVTIDLQTGETH